MINGGICALGTALILARDGQPWYDARFVVDRARSAEMDALREGRTPHLVLDHVRD